MRRIPSIVSTTNWFAAKCGSKMVKFQMPIAGINLFKSGTQVGNWVTFSNVSVLNGTITNVPGYMWGGSGGNTSFIIAKTTTGGTFLSSYNPNTSWNQCDGVTDTTSVIALFYK